MGGIGMKRNAKRWGSLMLAAVLMILMLPINSARAAGTDASTMQTVLRTWCNAILKAQNPRASTMVSAELDLPAEFIDDQTVLYQWLKLHLPTAQSILLSDDQESYLCQPWSHVCWLKIHEKLHSSMDTTKTLQTQVGIVPESIVRLDRAAVARYMGDLNPQISGIWKAIKEQNVPNAPFPLLTACKNQLLELPPLEKPKSTMDGDPQSPLALLDGDSNTTADSYGCARAFQYLMERIPNNPVKSYLCSGQIGEIPGMWNLVQVGQGASRTTYLVDLMSLMDEAAENDVFLVNGTGTWNQTNGPRVTGDADQGWTVVFPDGAERHYHCDKATRMWGSEILDLNIKTVEPVAQVTLTIPLPKAGVLPAANATVTGMEPKNSVTAALAWTGPAGWTASQPFQGGQVYTAAVTLTAAEGFQLTENTVCQINGATVPLSKGVSTVSFTVAKPVMTDLTLENLPETLLVPPIQGKSPFVPAESTLELTATAHYDNGAEAPAEQVVWTLSPEGGEGLSLQGNLLTVTSRAANTLKEVTLEANAAGFTASKTIPLHCQEELVGKPAFLRLFCGKEDVTGGETSICIPGGDIPAQLQLQARCYDRYGSPVWPTVTWARPVSDQGLVQVSRTDEPGSWSIFCTAGDLQAAMTIQVTQRPETTVQFQEPAQKVTYGNKCRFQAMVKNGDQGTMTYSVLPGAGTTERSRVAGAAVIDPATGSLKATKAGWIRVKAEWSGAASHGSALTEVEILKREVILRDVTAEKKVYDGTRNVVLSGGRLENSVDKELSVVFRDAAAESTSVTETARPVSYHAQLSGSCADNYVLNETLPEVLLKISPKPVTVRSFEAIPAVYAPQRTTVEIRSVLFREAEPLPNYDIRDAVGHLPEGENHPGTHAVRLELVLTGPSKQNFTIAPQSLVMEQENVILPLPAPELNTQQAAMTVKAYQTTDAVTYDAAALLKEVPLLEGAEVFDLTILEDAQQMFSTAPTSQGTRLTFDISDQPAGASATLGFSVRSRNHEPITGLKLTVTAQGKRNAELKPLSLPVLRYGGNLVELTAAVTYPGTGGVWTWSGDDTYLRAENLGNGRVRLTALKPTPDQASLTVTYSSDTTEASHTWSGLQVNKGQIIICVPDLTMFPGDALPQLRDLIPKITGLYRDDTLAAPPALSFGPGAGEGLGSFQIRAAGASVPENGCYEEKIIYVFGTLTVQEKPAPPVPPVPPVPDLPDWSGGGGSIHHEGTDVGSNRNPDGSITHTEIRPDGTVVETTQGTDGSMTVTETAPDGSIAIHEIDGEGNRAETLAQPDGSSVTEVAMTDGTRSRTEVDAQGHSRAQVLATALAVQQALETGRPFDLPLPALEVRGQELAPVVRVDLPATGTPVRVAIPVLEPTPGTVAVLLHPDGRQEILRKSTVDSFGVTLEMEGTAVVRILDNSHSFSDVPETYWAADSIAFVTARKLYNGTGENTFNPNSGMTRGMLAKVLHNLESNPTAVRSGSFSDVGKSLWCGDAISWAAEQGIVSGYADGSFQVGKTITREQLATMLYRYAGSPGAGKQALNFADSQSVSSYAVEAMTWAVNQGIIGGTVRGTLDPQGTATRAQVAAMLMRYLNK